MYSLLCGVLTLLFLCATSISLITHSIDLGSSRKELFCSTAVFLKNMRRKQDRVPVVDFKNQFHILYECQIWKKKKKDYGVLENSNIQA